MIPVSKKNKQSFSWCIIQICILAYFEGKWYEFAHMDMFIHMLISDHKGLYDEKTLC